MCTKKGRPSFTGFTRSSLRLIGTAVGVVVSVWLLAILGSLGGAPVDQAGVDPVEVSTVDRIASRSHDAVSLVSDGPKPTVFAQAPMLDGLVAAGQLPPVEDRLPENPLVMRGVDGVGEYGGSWMRLTTSPTGIHLIANRLSYHAPLRWSPMGDPMVQHVAEAFEASDDQRVFTIRLRKGHRWSDGVPFTTDDVMYWWDHEVNDDSVPPSGPGSWMLNSGKAPRLEQVDQQTFRVIYDEPNGLFPYKLASFGYWMFESPRHYLEPFHPRLGDDLVIAEAMDAYALPNPRSLYTFQKDLGNPQHPRLWPWIYRHFTNSPPSTAVRNPYYFAIDDAGQQLPYIDSMRFEQRRQELIPLEIANGKATMQGRYLQFDDLTEYMSRRESSGIDVKFWTSGNGSPWLILPNQNRRADDPVDPSAKWKSQYLQEVDFRRALSLAIDRDRIITSEYAGLVDPSQMSPGPGSPFRNEDAAKLYIEYRPDEAERLLDGIGFKRPSPGAMRVAPDGTPVTFLLDFTTFSGRGPADFVIEDWAAIGVNVIAKERARSLFRIRLSSRTADMVAWTGEGDAFPLIEPRFYVPFGSQSYWAPGWGYWGLLGGMHGNPAADDDGRAIEPPEGHPAREVLTLYERAGQTGDFKEQARLFREIQRIASENVFTINVAESPPQLVVTDADLRNVPENAVYAYIYTSPGNTGLETYYFDRTSISTTDEAAAQVLADSLINPTLRPGGEALADQGTTFSVWPLLRLLIVVGALGGLAVLGLRKPFIGGRLLLMVPTLFVLSILVFMIIQAPPGDYLQTRIMELEELGNTSAQEEVEELRETFHLDEPMWRQYLRWVGLTWFVTLNPADTGLLQGDLGRSMATSQPVNFVVGDRILLTVLISAGTILFTWSLALPIGIYSAVRQYSVGDYILTFIGFLGMCVPSFLLALVLMTVAGVSGLFSAEYAAQPFWDLGKVWDLLKHVWVPVVVLGVGGTASMIRIMRANLLDELRKPYVVTARAKGVRPTKLLIKYPVRLALNPFVSSIGGLFPQLVSGGAVVAMVLSLPTVGPLLLDALLLEDMYLAGSMLMVLSLLGIIGTLVSDLLLLWLDPRIRFEGGAR